MVKKAIIAQVIIFGFLQLMLMNPYFFDVRLKKAQYELDFWKLVKKQALDTVYFNHLNISKGKFLIIGYGSYSNEASPLFNEIAKKQQDLSSYQVIAISPFEKRQFDNKRDSAFSSYMALKYGEIDLDAALRGIPFTTIPEIKEQRRRAKLGDRDIRDDYSVVIVLENNKIVWAKKRVSDFSEVMIFLRNNI